MAESGKALLLRLDGPVNVKGLLTVLADVLFDAMAFDACTRRGIRRVAATEIIEE